MNIYNKIHLAIISTINLVLILFMIRTAWAGNYNAILIIWIGYHILTSLNSMLWFMLFGFQRPESRLYKWSTIGLIVLFIPVLIVASMY